MYVAGALYLFGPCNFVTRLIIKMPQPVQSICMTDDDPDDCYLFETALKEVNETVKFTSFSSCDALLAYLRSGNELPDLIILDMNMPGNGSYQCLLAIKKEARLWHIPVIIYSTSGTPSIEKKALECGAYKYLIKPALVERIENLVRGLLAIPAETGRSLPEAQN
jgi:DNA-binding NtrC family response regulator